MAALACALSLTACGGDSDEGTIPQDDGAEILTQLEEVEQQVENRQCAAAEAGALRVADAIAELPDEVDGELRRTLVEASARLVEQTRDEQQCQEREPPDPPAPTPGATGAEGVLEDEG